MIELKTLKIDSDEEDFLLCYTHNSNVVGEINTTDEIYSYYIKILTAFPLKDNRLDYFLSLDYNTKNIYMKSYIICISRKIKISNIIINEYLEFIKNHKKYINLKLTPSKIGDLLQTDLKLFIYEYGNVVKEELYNSLVDRQIQMLCDIIFEKYDDIRNKMLKNF